MQITSLNADPDTGTLEIRLSDGAEYQITNAGHARALNDKISVGGVISDVQRFWLEQYRVRRGDAGRERLKERLGELRREIREL